ncbi:MAG: ComEC/Rec2 family competence protein [Lachnospiraceae bacterium]|nr:ComEC/Rec2 family competence protein [Lachnospiraceae bacterium]
MGVYRLLMRMNAGVRASRLITLAVLILFVIYSGAGTSAVRAGIMTLEMLFSKTVRKRYDQLSALALSGIVILLIYPHDTGNAAFILSFSAIPGIYAANELELKRFSGAAITLTTLPGTLFFFYEAPVYGILINICVIPLTGCILVFAFASALLGMVCLPLGGMAAGTVCVLLKIISFIADFAGHLPFSLICTGKPAPVGIVFYVILLVAAFRIASKDRAEKEKARLRKIVSAGVVTVALCFLLSGGKKYELAFLSVGQGDCFVYMRGGSCAVVDCGSSDTGSVGKYILSPYLKHSGEILIDEFVVTHTDDDHVNGLIELLEAMPVYKGEIRYAAHYDGNPGIKRLIMPKVEERNEKYDRIVSLAISKNVEVVYASTGYTFTPCGKEKKGRAVFTCLAPANAKVSENETSLVFLLETSKYNVILTGDADISEEEEALDVLKRTETKILLDRQEKAGKTKKRPQTVILKAGHHGSRTSASEAFVSCLGPDIAVVSCGKNNSYGHPHKETIALFELCGTSVHRTDEDGALLLK